MGDACVYVNMYSISTNRLILMLLMLIQKRFTGDCLLFNKFYIKIKLLKAITNCCDGKIINE